MTNEGDRPGLPELLGPPADVGRQWVDAMEWAGEPTSTTWSEAAEVVEVVVQAAAARAESRAASSEVLADLSGHTVSGFPTFEDMTLLRAILRGRVVERLPQSEAMEVLDRLDATIDELVATRINQQVEALEPRRSSTRSRPSGTAGPSTATSGGSWPGRSATDGRSRRSRIDLDGLKQINDVHGHAAGDEALCRLADALVDGLRIGDSVYRVGGDEFVIVLPETEAEDVPPLLVRTFEDAPAYSFGVADAPDDASSAQALLAVADAQLIEGRRLVRNLPPSAPVPPAAAPAPPTTAAPAGRAPVPRPEAPGVVPLRKESARPGGRCRGDDAPPRGRRGRLDQPGPGVPRRGHACGAGSRPTSARVRLDASGAMLGIVAAAALAAVVQLDGELATAHIAADAYGGRG